MLVYVRLSLNKRISALEKHLQNMHQNEERQRSHMSASTASSRKLPCETPMSPLRSRSIMFDSQSYDDKVKGQNYHTDSYSEREVYTPKIIEINYIEGSNDKKWSSEDFLWSRKLEVFALIWYC